jgi:4-hydroxyproline epimerase
VRQALERAGITGEGGQLVDHVELFAPAGDGRNDSRNFVLCPGKVYDRSPCGTGLSAKLACLQADGKLAPGQIWRQKSITGSVFEGSYEIENGKVVPTITGEAWITADSTLILDSRDPTVRG